MTQKLNYAIIGNCRTSALVSENGSIDWCCLPDPDSDALFAGLLDSRKGGHFSIQTQGGYIITQQYQGNTNVLRTTFTSEANSFELFDFMPRYKTEDGSYYASPEIFRILKVTRGTPFIRIDYEPKMNFAASGISHTIGKHFLKSYTTDGKYESVYLYSGIPYKQIVNKEWIELKDDNFILLSYNQKLIEIDIHRAYLEYYRTLVYWLNWSNRTRRFPMYQKEITRSALVLKLLTYQKSGAIIAAVTTSIPESPGERRNWDYRYCWIRDSSLIIKVLLDIGHKISAQRFMNFLLTVNKGKHEDIQIMYGIRGEKKLQERVLRHLAGFQNSRPVRTGNSAYIQKQHDIYGILIDAIYISMTKFPSALDTMEELWTFVRGMVDMVAGNWQKPDRGIWEIRGESRHFVFSKMLSWVAADRGCRIARMVGNQSYFDQWSALRDTIKNDILKNGWNPEIKAFTQSYGSKDLDASILLMEDYGFIEATDPMFISTVLNIREGLSRNGMMFRYLNRDDFGIPKSSMVICTFWLINSLFKIGYTDEAGSLFNNLLKCSNHVGLFSEHIDVETKQLLGNFPQGYSHLGLIQSALLLNGMKPEIREDEFSFIKP